MTYYWINQRGYYSWKLLEFYLLVEYFSLIFLKTFAKDFFFRKNLLDYLTVIFFKIKEFQEVVVCICFNKLIFENSRKLSFDTIDEPGI